MYCYGRITYQYQYHYQYEYLNLFSLRHSAIVCMCASFQCLHL